MEEEFFDYIYTYGMALALMVMASAAGCLWKHRDDQDPADPP